MRHCTSDDLICNSGYYRACSNKSSPTQPNVTPEQLLSEADRCVKCGFCLPECPTYRILANEADSPRGRISLMQALAKGELNPGARLEIHLDRCLACRACESACPSGVNYATLLSASRALITQRKQGRPLLHGSLALLADPKRLDYWGRVFHLFRRTGVLTLANTLPSARLKRLLRLGRQLKPGASVKPGLYPATLPTGKLVQLFTGCMGNQMEPHLIQTSLRLLSRLGFAVEIPEAQRCCGALHRHNGYPDEADGYCEANRRQTGKSRAQALITLASTCHLELHEHRTSRIPVTSLTEFLLGLPLQAFPPLKPYAGRVAIHVPCSSRDDRSRELLQRIPLAEIVALADNGVCCGAAGSYMLSQPTLSIALGSAKIEHLKNCQADILVTGNTGCAMQFRQLIAEAGLEIRVMHPVELIARQWCGTSDEVDQTT
ncbi:MAG: (Fe-S)-binding protein [Candidatus Thiodiazotropha sp. (ex Dulcina madagascariensis)]|nr:(Fe-S)-binding protein [Candidatus Thiodiazotropha sp. (ex Dulcina madagascariensis)]MCU7926194.1 (Fe-S)-binding protein [Candidatus Thiodiazotropha sp. (ex Dulcina madagascariensis)]